MKDTAIRMTLKQVNQHEQKIHLNILTHPPVTDASVQNHIQSNDHFAVLLK